MQKQGKQYESDLANELYRNTDWNVQAFPLGYSGNHSSPAGDILVTTMGRAHQVELKKTSSDDHFYIPLEDLGQLYRCHNKYTSVHLGVKFSRRKLMMATSVKYENGVEEWLEDLVDKRIPDCFDPTITEKSLRLTKPSTDEWDSAREAQSDARVLAEHLIITWNPTEENGLTGDTETVEAEVAEALETVTERMDERDYDDIDVENYQKDNGDE